MRRVWPFEYTPDMAKPPVYEQIQLSYAITDALTVELIEICNWRPDFPACAYCGANEYWNIVWPTGLAVARYVAGQVALEQIRGRRVLVVGCGVGLESVVLAKLGARVSALDHVADALSLVDLNCALNDVAAIHTLCCCLHDSSSLRTLGCYDWIVGGDVHYELENAARVRALLQTVLAPHGRAVFADPFREGVDEFFAGLPRDRFRLRERHAEVGWISDTEAVRIYDIDRR